MGVVEWINSGVLTGKVEGNKEINILAITLTFYYVRETQGLYLEQESIVYAPSMRLKLYARSTRLIRM